jgi:PAS domain S-box-containing protein
MAVAMGVASTLFPPIRQAAGTRVLAPLVARARSRMRNRSRAGADSGPGVDDILAAASAAFVAIDRDGRIAGWNAAAEQMFGWPSHEACGRGFRDTVLASPLDRDDALARFLRTGDEDRIDRRVELMARHRDGHEIAAALTLVPLDGPGPVLCSVFLDDITDRYEALDKLDRAQVDVVQRLVRAAEYRDDATGRHTERVGEMAADLAAELALPARDIALIRQAATLHDVGKIAIPDAILLKPGRLTEGQREYMECHVLVGGRLLEGAQSPLLELAHDIALHHHERWDGAGYPFRKAGEDIPLAARIVAVVDAFDAMTHARPYKDALPPEFALRELKSGRGRQFDPAIVDAFVCLWERLANGA